LWPACALLLGATGCTDLPPTQTENPLTVSAGRKDIVSVCYNETIHTRSEIEAVARVACGDGTRAVRAWRVDQVFNDCPILKKTRASFVCVPARP
jgi:hypothetical protein